MKFGVNWSYGAPIISRGEIPPVTHLSSVIYRGCFTSCITGRGPLVIHGNSKYKTSLWWSPFSIIFTLSIPVFAQFSRWTIHVILNTHSLLVCFKDISFFFGTFFSTLPWREKWFTSTNIVSLTAWFDHCFPRFSQLRTPWKPCDFGWLLPSRSLEFFRAPFLMARNKLATGIIAPDL